MTVAGKVLAIVGGFAVCALYFVVITGRLRHWREAIRAYDSAEPTEAAPGAQTPVPHEDWQREVVAECERLGVRIIVGRGSRVNWGNTSIQALIRWLVIRGGKSGVVPDDATRTALERVGSACNALALVAFGERAITVEVGYRLQTPEEKVVLARAEWDAARVSPDAQKSPVEG